MLLSVYNNYEVPTRRVTAGYKSSAGFTPMKPVSLYNDTQRGVTFTSETVPPVQLMAVLPALNTGNSPVI